MKGERLAKKLVRDMLALMLEDLFDNDVFIFPKPGFGYLKIADIRPLLGDRYRFNIAHDGAVYGGLCHLDPLIIRVIGNRRYNFQLTQRSMARLRDLRDAGKKYR